MPPGKVLIPAGFILAVIKEPVSAVFQKCFSSASENEVGPLDNAKIKGVLLLIKKLGTF